MVMASSCQFFDFLLINHLLAWTKKKLTTTLNRGIKGTEKLKGPFKKNYTYLEHDVQPLHTSITIDVHHKKIFI